MSCACKSVGRAALRGTVSRVPPRLEMPSCHSRLAPHTRFRSPRAVTAPTTANVDVSWSTLETSQSRAETAMQHGIFLKNLDRLQACKNAREGPTRSAALPPRVGPGSCDGKVQTRHVGPARLLFPWRSRITNWQLVTTLQLPPPAARKETC